MKIWGLGLALMQNPVFVTINSIRMFPKPCVFAIVLARFGLAVAQWIAAWAANLLETHKKKHRVLEIWAT